MELDRELQRTILKELADCYPGGYGHPMATLAPEHDEESIIVSLHYLEAHGLLTHGLSEDDEGWSEVVGQTRITARGLDFLADDGGLSAILGVVTIKIHDDQVRLLLASRIQESDATPEQKKKWLDQLREIPADATKHLIHKLIDAGLAHWPAVLAAMQTLGKP